MPVIPLLPHFKGYSTLFNFSTSLGLQLTKNKNIFRDLDLHHHRVTTNTDTCPCVCLHPGHSWAALQSACTCTESQQWWSWAWALLGFFGAPSCYIHMVGTVQGCTSSHGHVQCSPSFWSFPLVWITKVTPCTEGQVTEKNLWRKIFKSSVFCQEGTTFIHARSFGSAVSVPLVEQVGPSKSTASLWFIADFFTSAYSLCFSPSTCLPYQ